MAQGLPIPDASPPSSKVEFPLSFPQERLWFLDHLEPGNPVHNLALACRMIGRLDLAALERSVNEIVRRHEILRTTFPYVGGRPSLVIQEDLFLVLKDVDLRSFGQSDRETVTRQLIIEESRIPFDLARGPLIRVCLFRLSEDDRVCLVVMHRIISDDISLEIFFRELWLIYEALADERSFHLADLPAQYSQFSIWQRQHLGRGSLEKQRAYWKEQLANSPPGLQLATDFPRQSKRTYRGSTARVALSQSLSIILRRVCLQEKVSPFILFLTAFTVLLYRYTEQDDILVGATVHGRNRPEFEPLIGCFAQSLPLRMDLSEDLGFRELLSRIGQTASEGILNQDFSYEEMLKEFEIERDLNREPLFQVRFQLRVGGTFPVIRPELKLEAFEFDLGMIPYDLVLEVMEKPEGFYCDLHCNEALFEAATIVRMAGHFHKLLESIGANQLQAISLLPILTDEERQQLLHEWNEIKIEEQETAFLHELFEAQATQTPQSVAVVAQNESITYCELDHRANQLAHYLQGLGVRPEVCVGICMERSTGLIVSILAIHKAGGACLPLDPSLPIDRLRFMLEASRSPLILAEGRFLTKLSALGVRVVCLDTIQEDLSRQKKESPVSGLIAQNLAQVFYTSGSSGEPKAVMWQLSKQSRHRSWAQTTFQLTQDDRYLMKSPIGFTPLTTEIFRPLLAGAKIIIAPPGVDQDSGALVKLMAEQKITILNFVPSMLRVILEEPNLEKCHSLRQVICYGEVLPPELEKRFFERWSAELNIVYGTTEAPGTTYRKCSRGHDYPMVNIGRRLPTRQVYVLNSRLQPAPIGVPGEIYSGGEDLVRGYLNRPELTAEKFIPNPFSSTPGARIYRTGDRARYLPDGSLEFLGRLDRQVKIRGFRVELGEIESIFGLHPQVGEAIVVARQDGSGERRLVAYVVLKQGQVATVNELRNFLKQKLPGYMVPSSFVYLNKLPLTPNGKVDRKALPVQYSGQSDLGSVFVSPRTPTEELLARIWCDLLGLNEIGVEDDFFDLGGHSLLAMQMISRMRNSFQIDLPVRRIFETPTVAGLAMAVVEFLVEKSATAENSQTLDTLEELLNAEGKPSTNH